MSLTSALVHLSREECQAGSRQSCETLEKDHDPLLELIPSISFGIYLVARDLPVGKKPLTLKPDTPSSDSYRLGCLNKLFNFFLFFLNNFY